MKSENAKEPSSTQSIYSITTSDLPLSCPMPYMRLWDSHPRIYLPISSTGCISCPYCGATYQLIDDHSTV